MSIQWIPQNSMMMSTGVCMIRCMSVNPSVAVSIDARPLAVIVAVATTMAANVITLQAAAVLPQEAGTPARGWPAGGPRVARGWPDTVWGRCLAGWGAEAEENK